MKTCDRKARTALVLLLSMATASMLLEGCAVKRMLGIGPPRPSIKDLVVVAEPGANQGNGTQLDIVVAYSDAAVAALPKTGPDWFRQRAALRNAFAKDIDVISIEMPAPGADRVPPQPAPKYRTKFPGRSRNKGLAVIAYANYVPAEGWPMVTLTPFKHPTLHLQPKSISVTEK